MNKIKQSLAGISNSGNKKKLLISLFTTLLIVASIVAIVATTTKNSNKSKNNSIASSSLSLSHHSHAILKSACTTTLYPELCFSAISSEPNITHKITNHKDVISLSLNITTRAVEHNYFTVEKLLLRKSLTKREKIALHDCLETIDETLDELKEAQNDLVLYPSKKTLYQHADDLKTLISSAITNQVTCLDGFSHDDADKEVRKVLQEGQIHVEHMCSNALAMTKNMTDKDIAEFEQTNMVLGSNKNRKLLEEENGVGWPEWISAGDRRLLQGSTVKADVVVAADGSGNFKTVSEAVAAAPLKSSKRYVIKIKAGVYKENVEVPKKKTNIMFLGDGRTNTIITGSRNVVDGSTTFHSATVAIVGGNFLARDITFQNTAGPAKHQAVALRVGADLSAFYNCDIIAYQDTLYVHNNRQFFVNCFISGTVDFIFGNSAVVFQNCDIHARRPNSGQKNMVTAQGRVDPNQNTGIVIQKCRIGATKDLEGVKGNFPTYLGRPWKEYSRTVFMQSSISDVIDPVGWHEWNGNFALNTLVYREYQNTGPGAGTSKRVTWKGFKVITSAAEAQSFTPGNFIGGSSWLGSTGFPFSLGL
ncbi:putative pectinesterase [Medicago truncatula]|uniref:Pectinesterase n=1 Tax=Medicago truncatula TaxID=3880 RepID=G7L9V7_MEDTR|nr:pectinesterase [Medicago truncatula]AET01934.1 pectinesterase/pectinesterase inhibitor [Medicago truncatula]RHN39573.1 putative pectinesterase [Medicago truncatula]